MILNYLHSNFLNKCIICYIKCFKNIKKILQSCFATINVKSRVGFGSGIPETRKKPGTKVC